MPQGRRSLEPPPTLCPVIDEPTPPSRSRRGRIELATAGMFVVLIAGAIAGFPLLRDRMVETARSTVDKVLPAGWAAYYLEVDDADPRARTDPESADARLMFASGTLPGKAARLLEAPIFTGSWSPNGERFVVTSGARVFLGDRDGQARPLTELRDLVPTGPPLWNGDNELLIGVTRNGQQQWLVTLDSRSGALLDQRDIGIGIQPYSASPDGAWLLAVDHRLGAGMLLEIRTGRRISAGAGESFAAWMSDGRILAALELERGSRLVARRPEGGAAETILELEGLPLLPGVTSGKRVAIVEGEQSGDPAGPRAIWLITPGEEPLRVARDLRRVYSPRPSHDGKFVGFSEIELSTPIRVRAGVIEVATSTVRYACEAGCAVLDVR